MEVKETLAIIKKNVELDTNFCRTIDCVNCCFSKICNDYSTPNKILEIAELYIKQYPKTNNLFLMKLVKKLVGKY
jgi:hypothetical protein